MVTTTTRREKVLVLLGLGVVAYILAAWIADLGHYDFIVGIGLLIAYAGLAVPYMRRHDADEEHPGELHIR